MKRIYADNAATTRMSDTAVKAMLPFLQDNFGNASSLYGIGQRAAESLQAARKQNDTQSGDEPTASYDTWCASESDNQAS